MVILVYHMLLTRQNVSINELRIRQINTKNPLSHISMRVS